MKSYVFETNSQKHRRLRRKNYSELIKEWVTPKTRTTNRLMLCIYQSSLGYIDWRAGTTTPLCQMLTSSPTVKNRESKIKELQLPGTEMKLKNGKSFQKSCATVHLDIWIFPSLEFIILNTNSLLLANKTIRTFLSTNPRYFQQNYSILNCT